MKRILAFMLAALMLLSIVACSAGDPKTEDTTDKTANTNGSTAGTPADTGDPAPANTPVFVYKGTTIKMNDLSDPIIAALGEPATTYESPSCAFQGMDIYYNYGSFELSAYEETAGAERRVYSVFLKDDLVETPEGLAIGSPEADVAAVYGASSRTDNGNYIYKAAGVTVSVMLTDGKVSSIEYVASFD